MNALPATDHVTTAQIVADPVLPAIRITRDFQATPQQVIRAHTDPQLFVQWVGPAGMTVQIDYWEARDGGSYRFLNRRGEEEYAFRGCFHTVAADRIVQTFSFEGFPDAVALETMIVTDLGDGWTRIESISLADSFEGRDAMLASGMETGVNDGYQKLDRLLAGGGI